MLVLLNLILFNAIWADLLSLKPRLLFLNPFKFKNWEILIFPIILFHVSGFATNNLLYLLFDIETRLKILLNKILKCTLNHFYSRVIIIKDQVSILLKDFLISLRLAFKYFITLFLNLSLTISNHFFEVPCNVSFSEPSTSTPGLLFS